MEAIYQSARPATFKEVVGQEHVKDVLLAALRRERTSHAYLFSGPRGVGKTTSARLLAMALNCAADDPEARPCGHCESCTMIRAARHPDVTELDAASNNSVEDVRELRERVRLASLHGGWRVWILDEAHMLSTPAANALLKTLEEPPPGLVFVLATTEPEKLPPTVLSRCQHFRFRRLSVPEITGKLAGLCDGAGVEAEPEALALVARAADGAMRDAESLLERLLASGEPIRRFDAERALGLPPRERLEALARAVASADLAPLLDEATALYRDGFSPRTVAEQVARTLRDALVADVTGEEGAFLVPLDRDGLLRTLHQFDDELERFQRHGDLYALEAALLKASNAAAGNLPAPFVAEAVAKGTTAGGAGDARDDTGRAARPPAASTAAPAGAAPAAAPPAHPPAPASADAAAATPSASADPSPQAPTDPPATEVADAPAEAPAEEDRAAPPAASADKLSWHQVKSKAGAQLKAFLQPADDHVADGVVRLRYGEKHRFHFSQLVRRQDELAALIEEVGGPGWSIEIEGPDETIRKKA
ncbi:MAG: DNA polymerase III subunit gamma/tau [Trueperaceae bacterium]|nr:DNA polymerase III subunit gamma/tau [Trueperaceae bacterium]